LPGQVDQEIEPIRGDQRGGFVVVDGQLAPQVARGAHARGDRVVVAMRRVERDDVAAAVVRFEHRQQEVGERTAAVARRQVTDAQRRVGRA